MAKSMDMAQDKAMIKKAVKQGYARIKAQALRWHEEGWPYLCQHEGCWA
jgi:hypothetical protein